MGMGHSESGLPDQGHLRCALVGLGRIGSMLEDDALREKPCTHAGAIAADRDCVLVGGCDLLQDRCSAFRERWGCTHVYTDVGELLDRREPDIVHIATPPETHLRIVESVFGSSARMIICEKPLAPSVEDAARIASYHQTGALKIITNHERRYSSDYLSVKESIEHSLHGELLSIDGRIYMGMARSPLEMLLDDGTHLIDLVRFLTGSELDGVDAELLDRGGVQMLFFQCSAGRVPVRAEIGSGRDHIVFELDLSFSAGRIRIGNGLYEEYRSERSPFYENYRSLMPTGAKRPGRTGYFSNMLRDAVRCARDPRSVPRSTAVDGYRAVAFIDQVRTLVGGGTRESPARARRSREPCPAPSPNG
jgi:predicted dehydrogenase